MLPAAVMISRLHEGRVKRAWCSSIGRKRSHTEYVEEKRVAGLVMRTRRKCEDVHQYSVVLASTGAVIELWR